MSLPAGIDWRATFGYVTDPTGCTYGLTTDTYPTTRGGNTFGVTASTVIDSRNRDNTLDARIAGLVFDFFSGLAIQFDLPGAGTYPISFGAGDSANPNVVNWALKDNTTTLTTISGSPTGGHLLDATGADMTFTAWPASNAPYSATFSSGTFNLVSGGATSALCHFNVGAASGGGPTVAQEIPAIYQVGVVGMIGRVDA